MSLRECMKSFLGRTILKISGTKKFCPWTRRSYSVNYQLPIPGYLMPAAIMADQDIKLSTAPFDPRFPNQNQTKHCFTSFLDHKRCIKVRGEDYAPCEYFKKVYKSLCPNAWVEKWETQIEEGRFPAKI